VVPAAETPLELDADRLLVMAILAKWCSRKTTGQDHDDGHDREDDEQDNDDDS